MQLTTQGTILFNPNIKMCPWPLNASFNILRHTESALQNEVPSMACGDSLKVSVWIFINLMCSFGFKQIILLNKIFLDIENHGIVMVMLFIINLLSQSGRWSRAKTITTVSGDQICYIVHQLKPTQSASFL